MNWILRKLEGLSSRVGTVETEQDRTKDELGKIKREQDRAKKVEDYHGQAINQIDRRVDKLERDKRGARISAGKQAAARKRAEDELRRLRDSDDKDEPLN